MTYLILKCGADVYFILSLKPSQLIQRSPRAMSKYVEAEILNHSRLRHPHVIQFKVRVAGTIVWMGMCEA